MKDNPDKVKELEDAARELRIEVLKVLNRAGSGHTGGSLSSIEILTTLYWHEMEHRSKEPEWPERDRFVLSKGHGAPALYCVLAKCGYFPREDLYKLRKLGCHLQGHPAMGMTPGVEVSTGSLGQGLSQAKGIALALRLDKLDTRRVYVLLGDGEVQEGQVWEAAMGASHLKLDNLCAIVDSNRIQIDDYVKDIKNIEPLGEKWRAFGWNVEEVDGHSIPQLISAFKKSRDTKGAPAVIIAHTIKGKGVSFMENNKKYHGIAPSDEDLEKALKELGVKI